MNCSQVRQLMPGYIDGEIDLVNSLEIEEHLRGCPACSQLYNEMKTMRSAVRGASLYTPAPPDLQKRIRQSIRKTNKISTTWPVLQSRWALATAIIVILAFVALGIQNNLFGLNRGNALVQEVEAAHVRSLMANHLTDVASSDQHTVKPWFAGKLDFSPPVVDLAGQGYPLDGGRLDYLDGHPVAALVYRKDKHLINLFIWPASGGDTAVHTTTSNGYHVYNWVRSGMNFWAVSDLNSAEMQTFVQLLRQN